MSGESEKSPFIKIVLPHVCLFVFLTNSVDLLSQDELNVPKDGVALKRLQTMFSLCLPRTAIFPLKTIGFLIYLRNNKRIWG